MANNSNYQIEDKKAKPTKLKKNEVEIIICPQCKKELKFFKYYNSFVCTNCNIVCKAY